MKPIAYDKTYEFEESYWWFKGRRNIVFNLIKKYINYTNMGTIVDIGCGTGITLKEISGFKLKIGIDESDIALKYSNIRDCGQLIQGNVYKLPLDNCTADCILLLDVLEHLDNEKKALDEIYRVSRDGCGIILTVPSYKSLWSGEDEISLHKRRYIKKEITNIIQSSGFIVERITYFNLFLMPLIFFVINFNKIFNPKAMHESDLKKLPKTLNYIFTYILYVESFLLNLVDLPFGASIVCVARKKINL